MVSNGGSGVSGCAVVLRVAWLAALVACSSEHGPLTGVTAGGPGEAVNSAGDSAQPDDGNGGRSSTPADRDPPSAGASAGADAGRVQSATPDVSGYCDGEPPLPADARTCRSHADCGGGANVCAATLDSGDPCGTCGCLPTTPMPCDSDDECESGRCKVGPFGVGCPTNYCIPSCRTTGCDTGYVCSDAARCEPIACDAGFSCGADKRCAPGSAAADDHGCEPIACDEGYRCPAGFACRPEVLAATQNHGCVALHCSEPGASACPVNSDCMQGARAPGCVPRACMRDPDCDCGSCVTGLCLPRPGVCMVMSTAGG